MPYYPGAHVDLLPEATTQPSIVPRLVILHTNAGAGSTTPEQLRAYMARGDITLECHFDIGTDGAVWQFMPVNVRADCNAQANPFAVSIETQDMGGGSVDVTPWSPAQCQAIVAVLRWLNTICGIPMVRCTAWNGSGVGAHRDFPQWSSAAHSCPGVARFAQVPGLIAAASNPPPPNPSEGRSMYHCKDAADGKFWRVWIDAYANTVACPVNELPDPDYWKKMGPIVDAIEGPLKPVAHEDLQALYDERGRPQLPASSSGVAKHHHDISVGGTTSDPVP